MQGAGKELLAGAGLTQQEHGKIEGRNPSRTCLGRLQHLALTDDLGKGIRRPIADRKGPRR
jgi:hypothetical protein